MKKLIALPLLLIFLTACNSSIMRSPGQFDQLAQCLTDKGFIMYGSETCPHCKTQREAFKGSFDLIDYVECSSNPTACEGIQGVPTWGLGEKRYPGARSLSELAELSDCELIKNE